ncbi:MAG: glycosyltransferase, partial [Rickettsiales bacterium]|nr:glycosyltransferase [Rickettsiales bacterium]
MANAPEVSVIIPCYRAEAFIERAVRSLLAQTFSAWEAILISDDGVDYAPILAAEGIHDSRLKFISSGRIRSGCGHPRNVGLDASNAPIIACLDADDAFAEDYLQYLLPLVQEHGFVMVRADYIDEATGAHLPQLAITEHLPSTLTLQHMPMIMLRLGQAAVIFDRNRVPAAWHNTIHVGEESLLLLQAFQHIPSLHYAQHGGYHYYRHSESLTHDLNEVRRFTAEKKRLLEHIQSGALFPHHPEITAMATRCFMHSLAAEQEY